MAIEDPNAEFVSQWHELFAFIYALVRNVHDTEDIIQEVWLKFSSTLETGVRIEKTAALIPRDFSVGIRNLPTTRYGIDPMLSGLSDPADLTLVQHSTNS